MSGPGVLPIVECGDPVLRRPAEPVGPADLRTSELQLLIAQMRATMEAAPGVGLAAPQVGVSIQLAVLHDGPERWGQLTEEERTARERNGLDFTVLVNPTLRLVDDTSAATCTWTGSRPGRCPPPLTTLACGPGGHRKTRPPPSGSRCGRDHPSAGLAV
jgi:peptide deformylase